MIRVATASDASAIANIYNHYILNTVVSLEEKQIDALNIEGRMAEIEAIDLPYLIAETENGIVGYAYASKWNGRCAYKHTSEITIYLAHEAIGQGLGTALYKQLFDELRQRNYHAVIAGISLPNAGSVSLHEKFGMEKVAHFKEVGFKFGEWVDVGYWQGML